MAVRREAKGSETSLESPVPRAIERLVALMHSRNESVAVRAAEALLDRGYGRPMHGMELSEHEAPPKHTAIESPL